MNTVAKLEQLAQIDKSEICVYYNIGHRYWVVRFRAGAGEHAGGLNFSCNSKEHKNLGEAVDEVYADITGLIAKGVSELNIPLIEGTVEEPPQYSTRMEVNTDDEIPF